MGDRGQRRERSRFKGELKEGFPKEGGFQTERKSREETPKSPGQS